MLSSNDVNSDTNSSEYFNTNNWYPVLGQEGLIIIIFSMMKLFIWTGIGWRFGSHAAELAQTPFGIQTQYIVWPLWIVHFAYIVIIMSMILELCYGLENLQRIYSYEFQIKKYAFLQKITWFQIVADTVFYSIFYALTMRVESDFFIFFFIPLLIGLSILEFSFVTGIRIITIIIGSLAISIAMIKWHWGDFRFFLEDEHLLSRISLNIWAPRAFFYILIYSVLGWFVQYTQMRRSQQGIVRELAFQIVNSTSELEILDTLMDGLVNSEKLNQPISSSKISKILNQIMKLYPFLSGIINEYRYSRRILGMNNLGYDRARIWLFKEGILKSNAYRGYHKNEDRINKGEFIISSDDDAGFIVIKSRKTYRFRYDDQIVYNTSLSKFDKLYPSTDLLRDGLEKQDVDEWIEMPLFSGDKSLGKLSIDNKFSRIPILETDIIFLDFLASITGEALRRVYLDNELERANQAKADHIKLLEHNTKQHIRWLHSLSIIATYIQDIRPDTESVLRCLLTGVTAEEGLGFSRAMFFNINDDKTKLKGEIAIGCNTEEEANSTWNELEESTKDMNNDEAKLFYLLDNIKKNRGFVAPKNKNKLFLNDIINKVIIPINESSGSLWKSLKSETIILSQDNPNDLLRNYIKLGRDFVCAPIINDKELLGVLIVDNRFINQDQPDKEKIDEDYLLGLDTYTSVIATELHNPLVKNITHIISREIGDLEDRLYLQKREFSSKFLSLVGESSKEAEDVFKSIDAYYNLLRNHCDNARKVLSLYRSEPIEELNLYALLEEVSQQGVDNNICYITINKESDKHSLLITGERKMLSVAFSEILTNAKEAMQENDRESKLEINVSKENSFAKVEFIDTGPGIPQDNRDIIFTKGFTTKSSERGYGLSMVKRTIEQHGGSITDKEVPEKGACFIVQLPLQ